MTFNRKADLVVEQAKSVAQSVKNWADFNNTIFGHKDGLVAQTFPEEAERQLFYDTEQYRVVSKMRLELMRKFGVEKGATPEKSGRVLLRIPKSLHKELEVEAVREGVSLNQLAASKLAMPLRERMALDVYVIADAYKKVFDGYSTDRVVVDPEMNARFLAECRKGGLTSDDYHINHALLDIRKSGKVELPKATKRTEFRDYDEYQFAAEIAVRIIQRAKGVTLDQILCDPALAFEFDEIAKKLAPAQTALKLRCAVLNLRKTKRLGPTDRRPLEGINLITAGPLKMIKPGDLPSDPGVYAFFDTNRPLFAGGTGNLQHRIELHFAGHLPKWLGVEDDLSCALKYAPMPKDSGKERDAWRYRFIEDQRPLLNYQRVA
jgi:hypothetical protein